MFDATMESSVDVLAGTVSKSRSNTVYGALSYETGLFSMAL